MLTIKDVNCYMLRLLTSDSVLLIEQDSHLNSFYRTKSCHKKYNSLNQ